MRVTPAFLRGRIFIQRHAGARSERTIRTTVAYVQQQTLGCAAFNVLGTRCDPSTKEQIQSDLGEI